MVGRCHDEYEKNYSIQHNDQSLNMPSQPTFKNNEHVNCYLHYGGEKEHPLETEGQEGEDNVNETQTLNYPSTNTPILG